MSDSSRSAAIYARYSSHAQRAESIEQQVDVCRAWCEAHGYDVAEVYADAARSGRGVEGRDAFLRMVEDARSGAFSAVVVYKLDRFARDRYDAAIYRRRLRDAGVEVRSAMEAIPEGPEGALMEAVVEGVAEWYSRDLSQKTMRGMRANAEKCMANGVPVYGYAVGEDGRYVVDEPQAEVVRRIFSEWIDGETAASIAERLASEGVRTATGGRPGKNWPRRIVHDERYIGTYVWDDVRIEGGMPAIVDAETFRLAGLRRRASHAPRRTHPYLLSGKMRDSETGAPVYGYSAQGHGGGYAYYAVDVDGRRALVRCDAVDAAAARAVRTALSDAALVDEVVERVLALNDEPVEGLEEARAELAALEGERARIAEAVRAGVPPETLVEVSQDVEERYRGARAAVDRLLASPVAVEDVRAAILELSSGLVSDAELIRTCVHEAVLYRDEEAVVVALPINNSNSPRRWRGELESSEVWLPMGAPGSGWTVVRGALLLRCGYAA